MSEKIRKQAQDSSSDWDWVMLVIAVLTGLTLLYVVAQIIRWIVR